MDAPAPIQDCAPAANGGPMRALDAHHQAVLEMLESMHALMRRIDTRGVDDHVRSEARIVHLFFTDTALNHHLDEERHVFPALLASGVPELMQATRRLQQDHGWIEEDWLELAPQLDALARGYTTFDPDLLRHGVEVFTALYLEHIEMEERLIYPQALQRLGPADLRTMARDMAERRSAQRRRPCP